MSLTYQYVQLCTSQLMVHHAVSFLSFTLNIYSSTTSGTNLTAISINYGPPKYTGKLFLRYPYGFEVGCGVSNKTPPTLWIEGTAKSISGRNINVEFPMCTGSLKPVSVRYCWRAYPCKFNTCPVYTNNVYPSPPFIMNLM